MGNSRNGFHISDLPPVAFDNLEEQLIFRLSVEILHNVGIIQDQDYFTKFIYNAETLDRDYKIWRELLEFEDLPLD
ncbi:MAG: hypothetical protein ACTSRE_16275 [Promethearchaeota archaeon]